MGRRVTKQQVENVFAFFCAAMRVPNRFQSGNFLDYNTAKELGAWSLDHNSVYGGYVIRALRPTGGEDEPMGSERCKAGEMVAKMNFAMRAIELINERVRNFGA